MGAPLAAPVGLASMGTWSSRPASWAGLLTLAGRPGSLGPGVWASTRHTKRDWRSWRLSVIVTELEVTGWPPGAWCPLSAPELVVVFFWGQWARISCRSAACCPAPGELTLSHSILGAGLPPLDWHSRRTWAPSLNVSCGCCRPLPAGRPFTSISGSLGLAFGRGPWTRSIIVGRRRWAAPGVLRNGATRRRRAARALFELAKSLKSK